MSDSNTTSKVGKPTPPVAPLTGSDWFFARASLAARRIRRFARVWTAILAPLVMILLFVSLSRQGGRTTGADRHDALLADTLRTSEDLVRAARAASEADSLLIQGTRQIAGRTAPQPQRAAPVQAVQRAIDPQLVSLDNAIREARRLRTPSAWTAVSNEPPVSGGPRMRALADSLALLVRRRDALPSGPAREQTAAPMTSTINRLGYTIVAIAENRRNDMAAAAGVTAAQLATQSAAAPAPVVQNVPPETEVTAADTAALAVKVRAAHEALARAEEAYRNAIQALTAEPDETADDRTAVSLLASPAAALALVLILGLAVRFVTALSREMASPTIAHALEAERAVGLSVLSTIRNAPQMGPARFRPSGVDPFRLLYLGLTSTGTRARALVVTGDNPVINATVGARFAISAAADHRATLTIDLCPTNIPLSRTFRERAEPGVTDALAGAFKWREVASAIGSSDGLPLTLLPAGTERDDLLEGEALKKVTEELASFRSGFEFTVIVAPLEKLDLAYALVGEGPLVLSATVGSTELGRFDETARSIREGGRKLSGTLLWDSEVPELPSRAELAALLSKQKGRTPGGSFSAVRKALEKDSSGQ